MFFFSIFESLTCALRAQVNISHFLSVDFLTISESGYAPFTLAPLPHLPLWMCDMWQNNIQWLKLKKQK